MDQQASNDSARGHPRRPGQGIGSFRFTFNVPPSSRQGTFIEPDPDLAEQENSESLTDSVQDYPVQFGRTYHAYRAGSYNLPNDTPEIERLAMQNEIITALFGGKLFFSPLSRSTPPRSILDVATGTGHWAIQMGDYFSDSEIIATDLSPIQPAEVPPNVNFYVEDSSEPWEYSQRFDYIHSRFTAGCWSSFKTQVAEQAFAYLNPGAWFESQEADLAVASDDGTLPEDGALCQWVRDLASASEAVERTFVHSLHLKRIYEEVGFVDVQERIFKIPTNGWPRDERLKELGRMWERNLQQGLSGFTYNLFHRVYGRSAAETEVSLVNVRRELSDTRIHAYMAVYAVWGRKPFPGEGPIATPTFR